MKTNVIIIKPTIPKRGEAKEKRTRVAAYCRVSTGDADQLASFSSQIDYYTQKIISNSEWLLVDIYADSATTGTAISKRAGFQRLIKDCDDGLIDLVMTKSISRFARNTVDTLNIVRRLRERKIAVYFEEENINTMTMGGELLLTVLSSVAQQEVQNTSEHVKKGIRMKLERGEMIHADSCFGYDFDKEQKMLIINEEEAKHVKYIFEAYISGAGTTMIAHHLNELNVKTKKGNGNWTTQQIIKMIRNEKYYGCCIYGKTVTLDPISKRRVKNKGEYPIYRFENKHEPIISKEMWDKANEVLEKRRDYKITIGNPGSHMDFVGKYPMSHKLFCKYCGGLLTRRSNTKTTIERKPVWKCYESIKKSIDACPRSKFIDEGMIEAGFMAALNDLASSNLEILQLYIDKLINTYDSKEEAQYIGSLKHSVEQLDYERKRLVNLLISNAITEIDFDRKNITLQSRIDEIKSKVEEAEEKMTRNRVYSRRLKEFTSTIKKYDKITEYDGSLFTALINRVEIGGGDDPYLLTFVFDTTPSTNATSPEHYDYKIIKGIKANYRINSFVVTKRNTRKKKIINSINVNIAIRTV